MLRYKPRVNDNGVYTVIDLPLAVPHLELYFMQIKLSKRRWSSA